MKYSTVQPDAIEAKIAARVDRVCMLPEAREWAGGTWTLELKRALAALGRELGHKVYGLKNDPCVDGGEWLFDLCWLEYDPPILRSAPLVAEIEFKKGLPFALEDFQKLLVARAEHRLMLFSPDGARPDPAENIRELVRHIPEFRFGAPGDRYQIGCWNEKAYRYEFHYGRLSAT